MATPNAFDTSAGYLGQAGGVYGDMANSTPIQANPYGPKDISADIFTNVNEYLNPYYTQVIDSALGRMGDTHQQNLNQVGANASASGAFGGARHGLVEAQLGSEHERNVGEFTSSLMGQGFNQALQTSMGVTNAELGRGQYMTGLQAGLDQFGQNTRQAGAQGLQGLGKDYFNIGNTVNQQQLQQGGMQQQLMQSIMDLASGQFGQQTNSPYQIIDMLNAMMQGSPLQKNMTGTSKNTTTGTTTPGLFDWISLGLQAIPAVAGVPGA